jgi:4-amino-4-deoxy-L-arabinose transferase-like glycosyltransferase
MINLNKNSLVNHYKTFHIISNQRLFSLIIVFWFLLNLLQAIFTGLIHDEAYYWVYSNNLDWGFFDHPPGIAVFIKLGSLLFADTLGLRILVVLSSAICLWLMWEIIKSYTSDYKIFLLLSFSVILIHLGGFLAVPDTALMFFASIFLYSYKRYLEKDSLLMAIWLGIVCAAMLYSKYHGILILFFIFISNSSLIKRKSFWIVVFLCILLFLPHIFWQFAHDFPTLKYHLSGRSKEAYGIDFTLNYILGQLLITGPFIGFMLFYACYKQSSEDVFLRGLKFSFWGIMLFFLASSFKGRVEANWTAVAFLPMILLSVIYATKNPKFYKVAQRISIPSIILIFFFRIFLMLDIIPKSLNFSTEVHNWDQWAKEIQKNADGAPVVFMNSYQKASKYSFYTGEASYSLNNVFYRSNQYNYWNEKEQYLQGKKVFFVPVYDAFGTSIKTNTNVEYYGFIDAYYSYDFLKVEAGIQRLTLKPAQEQEIMVRIYNPSSNEANFNPTGNETVYLNYTIEENNKVISSNKSTAIQSKKLKAGADFEQKIKIIAPSKPGIYTMMVTLQYNNFPAGLNGEYIVLTVDQYE